MSNNEQKLKRIAILKATIGPKMKSGSYLDKEYLVAHMIVTFGIAKRLASEEIDSVITYMEAHPEEWDSKQLTTKEEEILSTEQENV